MQKQFCYHDKRSLKNHLTLLSMKTLYFPGVVKLFLFKFVRILRPSSSSKIKHIRCRIYILLPLRGILYTEHLRVLKRINCVWIFFYRTRPTHLSRMRRQTSPLWIRSLPATLTLGHQSSYHPLPQPRYLDQVDSLFKSPHYFNIGSSVILSPPPPTASVSGSGRLSL
jgi:hypothetical protein